MNETFHALTNQTWKIVSRDTETEGIENDPLIFDLFYERKAEVRLIERLQQRDVVDVEDQSSDA